MPLHEKILKIILDHYNVSFGKYELYKHNRYQDIVIIRHWYAFFLKNYTRYGLKKIGKLVGGKNHATVLHSIKTINNLLETDKDMLKHYVSLDRRIMIIFQDKLKSVERRFKLDAICKLIELWSDAENAKDFREWYELNEDIEL